jgi:hypothetical protein
MSLHFRDCAYFDRHVTDPSSFRQSGTPRRLQSIAIGFGPMLAGEASMAQIPHDPFTTSDN